jgi:uncharacterized repeat protein (TIGR03837 family)
VRLWIDDLVTFYHLEPRCDPQQPNQRLANIEIIAWTTPPPMLVPGDIVIETFGCDPPPIFCAAMRHHAPLWINLEYLSAEAWIESCHGLSSPHLHGLTKYFFFPGFTPATGGLLREPRLRQRRQIFQQTPGAQRDFLQRLPQPPQPQTQKQPQTTRLVTLFCYPEAPLTPLIRALVSAPIRTLLLVPEGVAPSLRAMSTPSLEIVRIPFLCQDDYDHLLWCADLNIVRGEDSLVRATWAARPLLWQLYPQTQQAHLKKLEAWLSHSRPPETAQQLICSWNQADVPITLETAWHAATQGNDWISWQAQAIRWEHTQAAQPDLASNLIEFCAKLRKKC